MKKFAALGLVAALAFAPVAVLAQTDTPSPAASDTMMKKPMAPMHKMHKMHKMKPGKVYHMGKSKQMKTPMASPSATPTT